MREKIQNCLSLKPGVQDKTVSLNPQLMLKALLHSASSTLSNPPCAKAKNTLCDPCYEVETRLRMQLHIKPTLYLKYGRQTTFTTKLRKGLLPMEQALPTDRGL